MVIGLHWSSATPETIIADFDQIDFPARIVLPQGKYPRRSGYSWFPSNYGELDPTSQRAVTFRVKDEVATFVDSATTHFPTIGKPALVGTSYGGDLSYLIAVHDPELISAAFPVAARFPMTWVPPTNACRSACPPVLALHGNADEIVPVDGSRRGAQRLAEIGYPVDFREYEGAPHDFTARMKSDFTHRVRRVFATFTERRTPRP